MMRGLGRRTVSESWQPTMPLYTVRNFRELPDHVAAIFAKSGQHSFFSLLRWYDLMARHGIPPGHQTYVIADRELSPNVAIVLQEAARTSHARGLSSLTNFYSIEHDIIAPPSADLRQGLSTIFSQILALRPRLDCLRFSELDPAGSSYQEIWRALKNAGFLVECSFSTGTWYEDTEEVPFDDYLAKRPSVLRNTWRRKRRDLNRGAQLHTAAFFPGDIELEKAIADYEFTYAASWKAAEPFPQFMPSLMRLAAELQALRLGIYYIDGMPAAAQLWILWNGRAVIYKLAHNRKFDRMSLGTLLTMEMIERVLQTDRPHEISFGRGDDPYKKLWMSSRRERWNISAFNPRTISGLRLGLVREMAKLYHRLRDEPTTPAEARGNTSVP
jgi:hypothetical protein